MMKQRQRRAGLRLLGSLAVALWISGCWQSPLKKSNGLYRIPYGNGTMVNVGNDHKTHNPRGRIDMNGPGGSNSIVAAADGTIRYIVDNHSARVNSGSGAPCTNNYVWIEHPNGEWTKYSHMQMDSTTVKAKLSVGDTVKAGTYLGDEGEVGCASGPHLHFEVGVPRATDPIEVTGGFLKDNADSDRNRIPRICSIPDQTMVAGANYEARNVPGNVYPGSPEFARHGLPEVDYQCLFDQATSAGYELDFVDAFDVNGAVYFNAVFRPSGPNSWAAFHGLSGAEYQQRFDQFVNDGFRLRLVESYRRGGALLYAVIFTKESGPPFFAYHGRSAAQHQAQFDSLILDGWQPKNVSVVSIGGARTYAALYEKVSIGSFMLKSQVRLSDYQGLFDDNAAAGRQVVYLNGYEHNGTAYLSTIFSSSATGSYKARHGLSSSDYQSEWESARVASLPTRIVTGYDDVGSARYAAIWR